MSKNKIIVTGTGCVASSIVRALVPAGYEVKTLSLERRGLKVFRELEKGWDYPPYKVYKVLTGITKLNPFLNLEDKIQEVPHETINLSSSREWESNPFENVNSVILTAANPDSKQSAKSARRNLQIDKNSMNAALEAGVKNIVYTSSVWRTMGFLEDGKEPEEIISPEMECPPENSFYAKAKAFSVNYLKKIAAENKDRLFSYVDLGWYPRNTLGQPISNLNGRAIQWWIAECELQQHYLSLLGLEHNPYFIDEIENGKNIFGFNGFSKNIPPENLNHPQFSYDLTSSEKLGVRHEFNVYSVLERKTSTWRRIPIVDD